MMNRNQIAEMTPRIMDWLHNKSTYGLEATEALMRDCLWCLTHLEQVYQASQVQLTPEDKAVIIASIKGMQKQLAESYDSKNQPLLAENARQNSRILCNKIEKL